MSCRVVGMEIEVAAMATLLADAHRSGARVLYVKFVETSANAVCADFLGRCGFVKCGEQWSRSVDPRLAVPAHLNVVSRREVPSRRTPSSMRS